MLLAHMPSSAHEKNSTLLSTAVLKQTMLRRHGIRHGVVCPYPLSWKATHLQEVCVEQYILDGGAAVFVAIYLTSHDGATYVISNRWPRVRRVP